MIVSSLQHTSSKMVISARQVRNPRQVSVNKSRPTRQVVAVHQAASSTNLTLSNMGREKSTKKKGSETRHTPLFDEIEADRLPKPERNRVKPKKQAREEREERDADVCFIIFWFLASGTPPDSRLTRIFFVFSQVLPKSLGKKLLRAVRQQQEEEEEEIKYGK